MAKHLPANEVTTQQVKIENIFYDGHPKRCRIVLCCIRETFGVELFFILFEEDFLVFQSNVCISYWLWRVSTLISGTYQHTHSEDSSAQGTQKSMLFAYLMTRNEKFCILWCLHLKLIFSSVTQFCLLCCFLIMLKVWTNVSFIWCIPSFSRATEILWNLNFWE